MLLSMHECIPSVGSDPFGLFDKQLTDSTENPPVSTHTAFIFADLQETAILIW